MSEPASRSSSLFIASSLLSSTAISPPAVKSFQEYLQSVYDRVGIFEKQPVVRRDVRLALGAVDYYVLDTAERRLDLGVCREGRAAHAGDSGRAYDFDYFFGRGVGELFLPRMYFGREPTLAVVSITTVFTFCPVAEFFSIISLTLPETLAWCGIPSPLSTLAIS